MSLWLMLIKLIYIFSLFVFCISILLTSLLFAPTVCCINIPSVCSDCPYWVPERRKFIILSMLSGKIYTIPYSNSRVELIYVSSRSKSTFSTVQRLAKFQTIFSKWLQESASWTSMDIVNLPRVAFISMSIQNVKPKIVSPSLWLSLHGQQWCVQLC